MPSHPKPKTAGDGFGSHACVPVPFGPEAVNLGVRGGAPVWGPRVAVCGEGLRGWRRIAVGLLEGAQDLRAVLSPLRSGHMSYLWHNIWSRSAFQT
jgi:hypothetical protein